jgi:peptide/nickel transport system substrate-binding protein
MRRRALLGGSLAGGLIAAIEAACGSSNNKNKNAATSAPSASSSAASGSGSPSARPSSTAAAAQPSASAAAGEKPVRGGSLVVSLDSNLKNLDPLLSSLVVDRQVHYQLYDSLVTIGPDLKIAPGLADSWDTSDPKALVFKLHPNVKFHDGTAMDATAVKWNLDRILNTASSPRQPEISSVASVDVVDPLTVRLNLKAPAAQLLASLVDRAGMIVSPTAAQKGGQNFTTNPQNGGTGPFMFVEWVQDDHITVQKNPNYWRSGADGQPLPYLDKITYRVIIDENQRLNNLKTGDTDVCYRPPAKDNASIKKDSSFVYHDTPSLDFNGIVLNTTTAPFNNPTLRQAAAYAIDRNQILQTIAFGVGVVSNGPVSPPMPAYDANFTAFTFDVNKAKQLLQQAGMPNGFTFTLDITAGSPATQSEAELIKSELAQAGITANIETKEFTKLIDDASSGNFQASLQGWSGRIDPDGNMYNQFHSGAALNYGKYSSQQVDSLLEQARQTYDPNQRNTMYRQANQMIAQDVPEIFINHGLAIELHSPKVRGYVNIADTIMRFAGVWKVA